MIPKRLALVSSLALACALAPADAQQPVTAPSPSLARATENRPVEIELRSAARAIAPGDTVPVAIRLRPEPGWHAYWRHAGDVGSAPSIDWTLPDGFTADSLRWPTPELIRSGPLASYGYEHEVHLLAAVHVPRSARVGSTVTLGGTVTWVVCKVECVADEVDLTLALPVRAASAPDSAVVSAIAAADVDVPARRADWQFRAAVDDDAIVLRVRPLEGSRLLRSDDAERVHFFVDSGGLIDHAASPAIRVDGDELELRLKRSAFATTAPARLTGVLALAGAGGEDQGLAVEVDAPVLPLSQVAPRLVAAGGGGGWIALLTAGLLALVGGTLLNLMPCVLPVLSIKALGVAESAAQDAGTARRHAMLFGAGVLVSMWALVGTLLALRAAGAEVGWGYQLQSPAMVGALALLVFAAALNMIGVFEVGPLGGSLAATASRRSPGVEAFLSGVLVTALATPCSAPFLAAAVAYGTSSGALSAVVVFTALGLGLTWPLALVAAWPRARAWLPRPGAWMVTLRQLLAFPLLATVVWLAWVLGRQAGADATAVLLAALTLLAFGLWSLGRFAAVTATAGRRRAAQAAAIAAAVGALALVTTGSASAGPNGADGTSAAGSALSITPSPDGLAWQPYSASALAALRDSGRIVLVDFTADWCLTCKVNERVAFGSGAVRESIAANDVVLMKADWTRRDAAITSALAAFGRQSVPFVVLYGRDRAAEPAVLPTLLTPGIVTRAIDAAATN